MHAQERAGAVVGQEVQGAFSPVRRRCAGHQFICRRQTASRYSGFCDTRIRSATGKKNLLFSPDRAKNEVEVAHCSVALALKLTGGRDCCGRPESLRHVRQERDDHIRAGGHGGQLLGGNVLPRFHSRLRPGVRAGAGVLREAPQRGGVVVPGAPVRALHGLRRRPPGWARRAPVAPVGEAEARGRQVGRRRHLFPAATTRRGRR
jgi:hypothetical protein